MKGKIHRASVTQADLHYEGSISIDWTLLDAAGFLINERVEIYNIETGARFATYVIEAPRGSGTIGLNGAAARLAMTGDKVIIVAYTQIWVVWVRLFQLEHPTAIVCQSQKYPLCISVDHFWPVEIGKPLDNRGFSRFPTESHPHSITPSKTDERGPITLQMATIKECRSRWLRVPATKINPVDQAVSLVCRVFSWAMASRNDGPPVASAVRSQPSIISRAAFLALCLVHSAMTTQLTASCRYMPTASPRS